jgi:hypothetical protein
MKFISIRKPFLLKHISIVASRWLPIGGSATNIRLDPPVKSATEIAPYLPKLPSV